MAYVNDEFKHYYELVLKLVMVNFILEDLYKNEKCSRKIKDE